MKSDDEILNEKKFMDLLAQIRPDLWSIEILRQELNYANIGWLMEVMKQLYDIFCEGSYGDVTISLRGKQKMMIKSIEMRTFDEKIFI